MPHYIFTWNFKSVVCLNLSDNLTYRACPHVFTINLSDGFLYFVVLHLGQERESIFVYNTEINDIFSIYSTVHERSDRLEHRA